MSNKTVYVPVDPQGFGCGLLLGLIIRFWREILIAGLILLGCIGGYGLIQSISDARAARISATQNAIAAQAQATADTIKQVKVTSGLSYLHQYRGAFRVDRSVQETDTQDNFVYIDSVEFSGEGIRVYFEAESVSASAEKSCMVWQGTQSEADRWDFYYWGWPINEGLSMRPISQEFTTEELTRNNGSWNYTVNRYVGYVVFPYIVIPRSSEMLGPDTNYYFHFGCYASHTPILLFNVTDFSNGEFSQEYEEPMATEAAAEPAATEAPAELAPTEAPSANFIEQETLTVSFQDGVSGSSTSYEYYGTVLVVAEGVGQASSVQWSDPFYIFTDTGGQEIAPWHPTEFYNWTLWINGEPVDSFIEFIPLYNSNHVYEFFINATGGYLTFAVGDTQASDNNGYFTIRIFTQ